MWLPSTCSFWKYSEIVKLKNKSSSWVFIYRTFHCITFNITIIITLMGYKLKMSKNAMGSNRCCPLHCNWWYICSCLTCLKFDSIKIGVSRPLLLSMQYLHNHFLMLQYYWQVMGSKVPGGKLPTVKPASKQQMANSFMQYKILWQTATKISISSDLASAASLEYHSNKKWNE